MWPQGYRKFSLLMILFLALGSANARILKRDTSSSSDSDSDSGSGSDVSDGSDNDMSDTFLLALNHWIQALNNLPGVGPYMESSLDQMYSVLSRFERASNHAIDRLMSEALPCIVSEGLEIGCEGVGKSGGITAMLVDAINNMPDKNFPVIAKKVAIMALNSAGKPTLDTLLGGITQMQELSEKS